MKFNKLNSFYITFDIDKKNKHKNILLKLIDEMPNTLCVGLSKTDWYLDNTHHRKYIEYFKTMLTPHLNKLANRLHFNKWTVDNMWFQQYENNHGHNWHNHAYSNFSGVYYLELPNNELITEYYDNYNEKIFKRLNISEGQLSIFPSYILHRSPKNQNNNRKTVIAFNLNFEEVIINYAIN
jgi:hypothetical protein